METLDSIKIITEIISNVVTVIGVIIAGIWAYYNFIVGRSLSAHIELNSTTRLISDGEETNLIFLKITAKNLGKTKAIRENSIAFIEQIDVDLTQNDTLLLRIDKPLESELSKAYNIFNDHSYLEPGESISDELLIRVRKDYFYKARIVWTDKKTASSSSLILNPKKQN